MAPVGILCSSKDMNGIVCAAREASISTHGGSLAIAGAAATAAAVAAAVDGRPVRRPPELPQLTSLPNLSLFQNQLSGLIPPELGQLTSLVNLQLNQTRSTGSGRAEFRIDICLQSRDRQLGASHPRFCDR